MYKFMTNTICCTTNRQLKSGQKRGASTLIENVDTLSNTDL